MKGYESKNVLRVQVTGSKFFDKSLPPVHSGLKVFDLLPDHWAYPGKGVQSTSDIAKGTELVHYAGHVYVENFLPDTPYTFQSPDFKNDRSVIDASIMGNVSRFVNDPFGSELTANLDSVPSEVFSSNRRTFQTWKFVAKRDIRAGEELLVDYEATDNYWKKWLKCSHSKMSKLIPVYGVTYWICDWCKKKGEGEVLHCSKCDFYDLCSDCDGSKSDLYVVRLLADGRFHTVDTIKSAVSSSPVDVIDLDTNVDGSDADKPSQPSHPRNGLYKLRFMLQHKGIPDMVKYTCVHDWNTGKSSFKAVAEKDNRVKVSRRPRIGKVFDEISKTIGTSKEKSQFSDMYVWKRSGLHLSEYEMFLSENTSLKRRKKNKEEE